MIIFGCKGDFLVVFSNLIPVGSGYVLRGFRWKENCFLGESIFT